MRHTRDELRLQLIDAAERIIASEGLSALKARALADAAGCALGAIYTAFHDLDALVMEVNRRTFSLFEHELAGVAASLAPERKGDAAETARSTLLRLALAYLDFARVHPLRWRALFQHRAAGDQAPPDWYMAEQAQLFKALEAPLAVLAPDLDGDMLALRARSVFSAAHGVVSLGLDNKLVALEPAALERELEAVVAAMALGLSAGTEPTSRRPRAGIAR